VARAEEYVSAQRGRDDVPNSRVRLADVLFILTVLQSTAGDPLPPASRIVLTAPPCFGRATSSPVLSDRAADEPEDAQCTEPSRGQIENQRPALARQDPRHGGPTRPEDGNDCQLRQLHPYIEAEQRLHSGMS